MKLPVSSNNVIDIFKCVQRDSSYLLYFKNKVQVGVLLSPHIFMRLVVNDLSQVIVLLSIQSIFNRAYRIILYHEDIISIKLVYLMEIRMLGKKTDVGTFGN